MSARHIKVVDGSAIRSNQSLESPFITKNLSFIPGIAATRRSVNPLIGAHHLSHISILHQRFEGRQISLPQITLWQILYIETVSVPFRTAMHGKMLGTGQELDVLGNLGGSRSQNSRSRHRFAVEGLSLQTIHHGKSHPRSKIRVLAVGFLSTSPSWVTEYIDVRSPEAQTLVALNVAAFLRLLRLGSRLIAHGSKHLI